jgi:hypothetical protein
MYMLNFFGDLATTPPRPEPIIIAKARMKNTIIASRELLIKTSDESEYA